MREYGWIEVIYLALPKTLSEEVTEVVEQRIPLIGSPVAEKILRLYIELDEHDDGYPIRQDWKA